MFLLGPPSDDWQRRLFDAYQQSHEAGDPSQGADWEEYERGLLATTLFDPGGDGVRPIEALLGAALQAPTRVVRHELTWAVARGLWVTCIKIPISGVLVQGYNVPFPPDPEARDAIAAALGLSLRREWVVSMAFDGM